MPEMPLKKAVIPIIYGKPAESLIQKAQRG